MISTICRRSALALPFVDRSQSSEGTWIASLASHVGPPILKARECRAELRFLLVETEKLASGLQTIVLTTVVELL